MLRDFLLGVFSTVVPRGDEPNWYDGEYNSCKFTCDDLFIVDAYEEHGVYHMAFDLDEIYNKYTQCPFFIRITHEDPTLSDELNKCLTQAIDHLKTKEGRQESNTMNFPIFHKQLERTYD